MNGLDGYRARIGSFTQIPKALRIRDSMVPEGAKVANVLTPDGQFAGQLIVYQVGQNGTAQTVRYLNPIGVPLSEAQRQDIQQRELGYQV